MEEVEEDTKLSPVNETDKKEPPLDSSESQTNKKKIKKRKRIIDKKDNISETLKYQIDEKSFKEFQTDKDLRVIVVDPGRSARRRSSTSSPVNI